MYIYIVVYIYMNFWHNIVYYNIISFNGWAYNIITSKVIKISLFGILKTVSMNIFVTLCSFQ